MFSTATITSYLPPIFLGADLELAWTSSSPPGTYFQLYVNRVLTYHGTNTYDVIPMPSDTIQWVVGTVLPSEATTDFSYLLPALPDTKATLNWLGGTFEGTDIAGFFIYSSSIPGGAVSYTTPIGNISAYTGPPTDGFGLGGFGDGGFGESAASYTWTSGVLASGLWTFAVVPYDMAGNQGTASTAQVLINAPPIEPAAFADMSRLDYTFNPATEEATLTWNASPSAQG